MDAQGTDDRLYRTLAKAILLAAGLWVLLWFLESIVTVLLIFATAMVLAIALNAPVQWLEQKRVPRPVAAISVLLSCVGILVLVLWLVIPAVVDQGVILVEKLPTISRDVEKQSEAALAKYPELRSQIGAEGISLQKLLPNMRTTILRVGSYTLSLVGAILFGVIIGVIVMYALVRPRPLVRGVLEFMPEGLRHGTEQALAKGSASVVAWLWANIIIGSIEAVCTGIFCQIIGIPGAFVWGALAFFAELVPSIGVYFVSVPVLLVALSVSPMTALWTLLFFVALNQVTSLVVSPLIVGKSMKLHPVSILFAVLALGSAFGFLGAVLALPLTGFIKAFYDEFYGSRQPAVSNEDAVVEAVLDRDGDSGLSS
ncbi:MAG TPA: AI-2E family transporter [Fimbriimonas sp.]|nr:AI-2E family transporter [Fimbriimonas sp.]